MFVRASAHPNTEVMTLKQAQLKFHNKVKIKHHEIIKHDYEGDNNGKGNIAECGPSIKSDCKC